MRQIDLKYAGLCIIFGAIIFLSGCDGGRQTANAPDTNPAASISSPWGNVTITQGGSVNFAATVTGGEAPYTHVWDFGTPGEAPQTVEDPDSVTFNTLGTFTVTYTVTDSDGDTDSATRTVTVNAPDTNPAASISSPWGNVTITQGGSVNFAATVTGGEAPYTHVWDFGTPGEAPQTVEDPDSVTFNTLGTFTVKYTVWDSDGDTSSATRTVTVTAPDTYNGLYLSDKFILSGYSISGVGYDYSDDEPPHWAIDVKGGYMEFTIKGTYDFCFYAKGFAATPEDQCKVEIKINGVSWQPLLIDKDFWFWYTLSSSDASLKEGDKITIALAEDGAKFWISEVKEYASYPSQQLPEKFLALFVATSGNTPGNDEEKRKEYVDHMAQKAKEKGFNVVNLILDWNDLQPEEEVFKFDTLDAMIISIKAKQLFCILRIYANGGDSHQALPEWIVTKLGYPEYLEDVVKFGIIENIHPKNEEYQSKFKNFLIQLAGHFNTEKKPNQFIQPDAIQITLGGVYGEQVFGATPLQELNDPEMKHIDMAKEFIPIKVDFIVSVNSLYPDNTNIEDTVGAYAMYDSGLSCRWVQSNGGTKYLMESAPEAMDPEGGPNNQKMLIRFKNMGAKIILEDTKYGDIANLPDMLKNLEDNMDAVSKGLHDGAPFDFDGLCISVDNMDDPKVKDAIGKIIKIIDDKH